MIVTFEEVFSRAGDEMLQDIIGANALKLISMLNNESITVSSMKKLVLSLYSYEELLLDKHFRTMIIDLLREHEVQQLCQVFHIPVQDSYENLKKTTFNRGSSKEELLFNFFSLTPPEVPVKEEYSSNAIIYPSYQLFKHQRTVLRKVQELLDSDHNRVLLHMPTGSGKTRTAMNIIANHLRVHEPTLVIWLAYSEELCEQSYQEFVKAWENIGDRQLSAFRFWGSYDVDIDSINDGLVVAGLSKIFNLIKSNNGIDKINSLGRKCSLIILDEAHQAVAETYSLVLNALSLAHITKRTAILGLSATPGRTWQDIEEDLRLSTFFENQKVTLSVDGYDNPIDYLVSDQYLAKTNFEDFFYDNKSPLSVKDINKIQYDLEIPKNILISLSEDDQRNLLILKKIMEKAKSHKRILVFAITVEHSNLLAFALQAQGIRAYSITSKSSNANRKTWIEEYKSAIPETIVLCNFGVLTTGFDAPATSCGIITRPTTSLVLYSQMVGRAIRGKKAGGNEVAEIVTVIDKNLPGFSSIAEAFNNWEDVWNV